MDYRRCYKKGGSGIAGPRTVQVGGGSNSEGSSCGKVDLAATDGEREVVKMRGVVTRWLINTVALLATASVIKGIRVEGVTGALVAAAVLGIVNAFIRPLIVLLTLPFNILTLGLLTFVINGLMLLLVSTVVKGLEVQGFWPAVVGSLMLSLVSGLISMVVVDK